MIFIDLLSTQLSEHEKDCLKHPLVSGLTLFGRNCETVEQVAELTAEIKQINPNLAIAIDQEGGRVQRIKDKLTALPAMHEFGKLYDKQPGMALEKIAQHGWLIGAELKALGIDIDFAPVLDIHMGISSVIGDRALHREPNIIYQLAGAYIKGMSSAGVLSVAKHFPGHGCVELDSHVDAPIDYREFEELWQQDLVPYKALIQDKNLPAIMMSHVIYPKVSDKPAGFCDVWVQQILREKLAFNGLVFTDDLTMKAAHFAGNMQQRIISALTTGCDVALVCNYQDDLLELLNSVQADLATKKLQTANLPIGLIAKKTTLTPGSLPELQKMEHYLAIREFVNNMLSKD